MADVGIAKERRVPDGVLAAIGAVNPDERPRVSVCPVNEYAVADVRDAEPVNERDVAVALICAATADARVCVNSIARPTIDKYILDDDVGADVDRVEFTFCVPGEIRIILVRASETEVTDSREGAAEVRSVHRRRPARVVSLDADSVAVASPLEP